MSLSPRNDVTPPDLPGYRFLEHIGAGGNAQVYLYEQALPLRKVAVKVLNESALSDAARRRFTTEANVTAGLAHRHIVQVFDANVTSDGRPYLVMPYYSQPNLSVRARRSHFSVADVLRIGVQIGSAVETSHRHDVLHRDIKPQNILTDAYGEPVLTDFGIAATKGADGADGLSVPWSPPEILYGTATGDQRSDVYSVGATLWHLLVGRSPFELPGGDNTTYALMGRIKSDPPPRTQRADVPDSLERLLRQTMAKDPAARPQTAMELIRGLQSIEQELRLPLTQPILPADEPPSRDPGGDTMARPVLRSGETTFSRAAAPWSTRPPGGPDGATGGTGAGFSHPRTHTGQPAWSAAPGARTRYFPPEPPEDATMARSPAGNLAGGRPAGGRHVANAGFTADPFGTTESATFGQAGASGDAGRPRTGRVLVLVGGGALLAIVAVVAVLMLGRSTNTPTSAPTTAGQATLPGGAQDAIGASAPGVPDVTVTRIRTTQVKFSWTYINPAAGDTFQWKREVGVAGAASGTTAKPDLLVTVARGQSICIEVRVARQDGTASDYSPTVCWPPSPLRRR